MMNIKAAAALLTLSLVFAGCKKSPFERTTNNEGGALGSFGVAGSLKVFSDELFSGGGAFLYPGGENQTLAFNDLSNPVSARSIRYVWNGKPPAAGSTSFSFAGFDLMHTATETTYSTTAGRDLRAAGYRRVTFYARGSLSTNTVIKIEVADDGIDGGVVPGCLVLSTSGSGTVTSGNQPCSNTATLSSNWTRHTITITDAMLASVKDYFKATFVFTDPFVGNQTPGQGGTLYVDAIFYEP